MKRAEARIEVLKIMALARNTALNENKLAKSALITALGRVADQLSELADKLATA